jgi:hypothetical protein
MSPLPGAMGTPESQVPKLPFASSEKSINIMAQLALPLLL